MTRFELTAIIASKTVKHVIRASDRDAAWDRLKSAYPGKRCIQLRTEILR